MLIELYLFFAVIAVFLFLFSTYEKSRWIAMINIPFIVILVPSSFNIEEIYGAEILTNATSGTVHFFSSTASYTGAWPLSILWAIFLFLDITMVLLLYTTEDFQEMIEKLLRRNQIW